MSLQEFTGNTLVCDLIQDAVLKICTEHMNFSRILEVDGIICISPEQSQKDLVVKIHRTIVKSSDALSDDVALMENQTQQSQTARFQSQAASFQSESNRNSFPSHMRLNHTPGHQGLREQGMRGQLQVGHRNPTMLSGQHGNQNVTVEYNESGNMLPIQLEQEGRNEDNSYIDYEVTQNSPDSNTEEADDSSYGLYNNEEESNNTWDQTDMDEEMLAISNSSFRLEDALAPLPEVRVLDVTLFPCPWCKSQYSTVDELEVHLPVHGENTERFKCKYCSRYFARKSSLTVHYNKMTCLDDQRFECVHCQAILKTRQQFKLHMGKHYRDKRTYKKKGGKAIACKQCDLVLGSMAEFERHMKTHPANKPYKCKICNKGFQSKGGQEMHMKRHRGEDPYKSYNKASCTLCDRVCVSKSALANHMRVHDSDRPFPCDHCSQRFIRLSDLKGHAYKEHGITPIPVFPTPNSNAGATPNVEANPKDEANSNVEANATNVESTIPYNEDDILREGISNVDDPNNLDNTENSSETMTVKTETVEIEQTEDVEDNVETDAVPGDTSNDNVVESMDEL
ncbi:unnamed protein product [Owenia fusiformis]|uniref:C2H2-type domain-containing protein n=1 Tax=Owenia fusiformis TaxID=6347 RepID=A0A8S4P3N7_OWEFU|nr:unnamed protein product [Owenia fusiformis]